jgi:hypothetical protein
VPGEWFDQATVGAREQGGKGEVGVHRVQENDKAGRRPKELEFRDEAGAGERWGADGGQYDAGRAGGVMRDA